MAKVTLKLLFIWLPLGLAGAMAITLFIANLIFSSPSYQGPVTDHFDGKRFFNHPRVEDRGFFKFLKWMWTRKPGAWQQYESLPYGPRPPDRVEKGRLRVTFINHSTVLIQMDGLNILIDPVWSERIGPLSLIGPKRHISPGIGLGDLPPLDLILISHNHYDHLDIPTLKKLTGMHNVRILTGLGNTRLLNRHNIKQASDMDWWEESKVSDDVSVSFVPARHFSSRSFTDRNSTLWGGFVIKGPAGVVYFASDTGLGPHFEEIKKRFGAPRLAFLPIGAFLPRWFMGPMHLSPEEALQVHQHLGAKKTVAVHYGTFRLGDDGQFEAVEGIQKIMKNNPGIKEDFWLMIPGEGRFVP